MSDIQKIQNLIEYLNRHTTYYDMGEPKISDAEWDEKYFELKQLEEETGIIFNNSPTQSIQYNVVNSLKKVKHSHKMLSLDKTKSVEELLQFLKSKEPYLVMLKMDGLTCSLTYEDGNLVSAETRGDGLIGEDILHNAKVIKSIPQSIPYKGRLVIDGEIICKKDDFVNFEKDYKNPRNFAAGSIRLLDSKECVKRNLTFVAWEVIEGMDEVNSLNDRLNMLYLYGFIRVPVLYREKLYKLLIEADIETLSEVARVINYPIDGIVFKFDNIEYGKSLGETEHHFKNAIAYKFGDDTYETELIDIEWTMGRTGVLTPVAIFEPIDIDGSTVERASLHNLTIMNETLHGNGWKRQKLKVYKANMIIPQIASAQEDDEWTKEYLNYPHYCPLCGSPTETRTEIDSTVLICTNDNCSGKLINRLDHFCGKKGLDIKGLSKATLEKLIDWGWVSNFTDLFQLAQYTNDWTKKAGFGQKSVMNILTAIENSRHCDLDRFIAALGIPLIGSTASKALTNHFKTWQEFREAIAAGYKFYSLNSFGSEMNDAIINFDYTEADYIADNYIYFISKETTDVEKSLEGKTFVITGKLSRFKNRDALKSTIESLGGKVTGSVSKNTDYLINNDTESTSSKNQTAKSLGIPVMSEEDFVSIFKILD